MGGRSAVPNGWTPPKHRDLVCYVRKRGRKWKVDLRKQKVMMRGREGGEGGWEEGNGEEGKGGLGRERGEIKRRGETGGREGW